MPSSLYPSSRRSGIRWFLLLLLTSACAYPQGVPVPATSVPLLLPSAIAYDPAGNLYLAESQGHRIRKVDTLGNIAGLAGDGTQGFSGDGGAATGAQLNSPEGLAVDPAGNVYLSDSGNNRVRRVDAASGTISTVAGNGSPSFSGDGGPAPRASLDLPRSIALDATAKHLYIADTRNHRIRVVDLASGTITTVAGNGIEGFSGDGSPATSASLDSPDSMALDGGGNLYIADTHNGRIRRVAADTRLISTIAGPGSASAGTSASPPSLGLPRGLTADTDGNLYIAESGNHRVLRIDHISGAVTVAAGTAIQSFAGDQGPAVLAALNSPRSIAISPSGLLAIADTGNARVRQLLAIPAPTTPIQTVAGLGDGAPLPGVFSLAAPTSLAYGGGTLTASFTPAGTATGQVTFYDVGDSSTSVVGKGALTAGMASVSLSTLNAGQHHLLATYPGDSTHPPAQASAPLVTISPLPLRATPNPSLIPYGAAIPALTGSLTGLLVQDANKVTAGFTSAATPTSVVGAYPISVALSGAAAANYTVQQTPANVIITQANTSTLLRNSSSDGSFTGALQLQVASSTSGSPTGFVTLADNGAIIQQTALTATGSADLSALNLASGAHAITATYSGDPNFLPSTSPPLAILISSAPAADFTLAAAQPSTQVLLAGTSVAFNLSAQMTSPTLSSPIVLSVTGLPAFTTASFNPAYIPPGSTTPRAIVLTITAAAASARLSPNPDRAPFFVLAFSLPLIALFGNPKRTKLPKLMVLLLAAAGASTLLGCGDRTNTSAQGPASIQTYTVTVTGTSTDSNGSPLQHSADLTLQMTSAP